VNELRVSHDLRGERQLLEARLTDHLLIECERALDLFVADQVMLAKECKVVLGRVAREQAASGGNDLGIEDRV
jgi:hypothetical protein